MSAQPSPIGRALVTQMLTETREEVARADAKAATVLAVVGISTSVLVGSESTAFTLPSQQETACV